MIQESIDRFNAFCDISDMGSLILGFRQIIFASLTDIIPRRIGFDTPQQIGTVRIDKDSHPEFLLE